MSGDKLVQLKMLYQVIGDMDPEQLSHALLYSALALEKEAAVLGNTDKPNRDELAGQLKFSSRVLSALEAYLRARPVEYEQAVADGNGRRRGIEEAARVAESMPKEAGPYAYAYAIRCLLSNPVKAEQAGAPVDSLCERICAAIKSADDKSVDEAGYMLDSNDCIKIVREQFAGRQVIAAYEAEKQACPESPYLDADYPTTLPVGDEAEKQTGPKTWKLPPGEELWDADPNCNHEITSGIGGGIKCIKCRGWFCH